jgi:hypothetical protein
MKMRHVVGRQTLSYLLFGVLCLFLTIKSEAQTSQQFTGHVQDATGAVVPRATVTVHNQLTNIDVKTVTTSSGIYTVTYLNPGLYTVSVAAAGFKTEAKTDITLNVDQVSTIDFKLAVGSTSEVVTVNASNAQIELSKADRGEVVDGERITELPLDGRDPYELFSLSPGTHDTSALGSQRPFDDSTTDMYVNGSKAVVSLSIDGVTNDSGGGNTGYTANPGYVPSVDVVQEFKVVLNEYDASYGRSGGSAIDLALKSGTNKFHGTADDFYRRTWLDSKSWIAKYNKTKKAEHKRDQFSFEGEGPLQIPHLFNGKDKLFYVVSYEEMNEANPSSSNTYSIPNPKWIAGDFSTATYWNTATGSLQPLTIYDPLTPLQTVVDSIDGKTKQMHSAFANNIIPSSRIDSVTKTILSYYNLITPNVDPGSGYAPYTNNYYNLQIIHDFWRNALIKVDYHLSDQDNLSFRYGGQGHWDHGNNLTGYSESNPANMNGHQAQPKSQTGAINWTHTFNPNLLLNVGTTLMTQCNYSHYGRVFSNVSKDLGFSSTYYSQLNNNKFFPYITAGGLSQAQDFGFMGYTNSGSSWNEHTLAFIPTITFIRDKHTLRAGVDLRFEQFDHPLTGTNDQWAFDSGWTNGYYNSSAASGYSSGMSIASELLGYPSSGTVYYNLHQFFSEHSYMPWLQDDWKITKKLTLNFGVRWDLLTPRVERHNKMNGRFNGSVVNPVSTYLSSGTTSLGTNTTLMGGLEFAGVNGEPRSVYAINKLDIQPRIGFAYEITPTMSIRGGVGESFFYDKSVGGSDGFSTSTSYISTMDNGMTPYTGCSTGSLSAGTCSGPGFTNPIATVLQPTGSSLGYLQDLGSSLSFYNPHYKLRSL